MWNETTSPASSAAAQSGSHVSLLYVPRVGGASEGRQIALNPSAAHRCTSSTTWSMEMVDTCAAQTNRGETPSTSLWANSLPTRIDSRIRPGSLITLFQRPTDG